MKRTTIQMLMALLAAPLVLTGCTQDDLGVGGPRRTVSMTATASRGALTRTILEENAEGDLDCRWQQGDRLIVATLSGTKLGELSLVPGADDASVATFKGEIEYAGEERLNFIYPGKNTEEAGVGSVISVAAQDGTLTGLTSQDVLTATAAVSGFEGGAQADLGVMDRKLAFGRFRLSFPAGVDAAEAAEITVDGTGVMTSATLAWGGTMAFEAAAGAGAVSVSVSDASADFWLAVIPQAGIEPTFSVTLSNGSSYTGTLASRDWKAGEYVRASSDDGTFAAVAVPMKKGFNPYPGEDPRNPLHKFAKYNLTRIDGLENGFTGSETENGALYQWGRNYGYMDKSGTYPGSNVRISGDFTNYFDALGSFEWFDARNNASTSTSNQYYRVFDYYVYNPNSAVVLSGTGLKGYSNGYEYWANIDNFKNYNTLNDLKAVKDRFFMDYSNQSGDYWITSVFGDGGNTWEERATACGYDVANPCPEGWRMPTEADFKEIIPSSMPSQNSNLSTLITNKAQAELRESRAGIRYVIRWLNYVGYLKIEAIVVDASFQESDIRAIVWDNNPSVVSRIFPYTGNITQFNAPDTRLNKYLGINSTLVIPYVHGAITQTAKEEGDMYGFILGSSPYYYPWTLFTPAENFGGAIGGYWTDTKVAMQFYDTAKSSGSGFTDSYLRIRTADPEIAYAIRPVME